MGRPLRLAMTLYAAIGGASVAHGEVFEVANDGTLLRAGQAVAAAEPLADDLVGPNEEAPPLPEAAITPSGAVVAPAHYQAALLDAATRTGVSPDLLAALVWQESRWQVGAVSPKGAIGLAQFMPATARSFAVDPRDGNASLMGAARYLRQLLDLFDGDVERALAAYNAGPARVLKANGVPPIAETRAYVATIIGKLASIPGASK